MAGFMKLQVWRENTHEHINGSGEQRPASHFDADEIGALVVSGEQSWWGEYTAPGYLDKTDPCGPFKSPSQAACETFLLFGDDTSLEDEAELISILENWHTREEAEAIVRKLIS